MNQTQKNYTCKRIREIAEEHRHSARQAATSHGSKNSLTHGQRLNLVRRGKVKLLSPARTLELDNYRTQYIEDVFDFSAYEWDAKVNSKSYDKAIIKINQEELKVIDAVMLGGEDEALKCLQDFQAMKF